MDGLGLTTILSKEAYASRSCRSIIISSAIVNSVVSSSYLLGFSGAGLPGRGPDLMPEGGLISHEHSPYVRHAEIFCGG